MADLFATGRVVDCILLLMLLEAALSLAVARRLRRGIAPVDLVLNLAAGASLLLALRAALLHAAWPAVAIWLIVALAAHIGEAGCRWTAAH